MPATTPNFVSLYNQVSQLAGNLTKMISSVGSLTSSINNLTKLANNVTYMQQVLTKSMLQTASTQFTQLANMASLSNIQAAGINFTTCMNKTQINLMNKNLMTNITTCIKNQASMTTKLIQSHIYILKNSSSFIATVTKNILGKCGTNRTCYTSLLNSMTSLLRTIPTQIKNYYNNDVKLMQLMPVNMSLCSAQVLLQTEKNIALLGMKHVTCAYQLIRKKYTTTNITTTAPATAAPTTAAPTTTSTTTSSVFTLHA